MEWDLLRTFEAVARLGSLRAAAGSLGVNQSTVSRQLDRLEEKAGSPLLLRGPPVSLTARGERLLASLRPMMDAALEAKAALEESPVIEGEVTLTTVGEIARWILAPALPLLYRAYPGIQLRVLVDNRVSSLAAGEADIALRFAKPSQGDLVSRRLYSETFALFAAESLPLGPKVPWLGLAGSLAHIPEQKAAENFFQGRPARLLVEDVESLGKAVEAGLGVGILPTRFASQLHGLREVSAAHIGYHEPFWLAPRDVWLVVHRAKQKLPLVRAVLRWVTGLPAFASAASLRQS